MEPRNHYKKRGVPKSQKSREIKKINEMKNKNRVWIYSLVVMGFVLMLSNGCKKKDDNKGNSTPIPTTITDIDGNVYHTVTIGTQVWMVENLKVTKYRNGDPIPNITDGTQWGNLTIGAYCNYNNDANNTATYGRLYNWYALNDSRNIAPSGWHVPTDAEWTELTNYLGGESVAGGKLKEIGTTHWYSPNSGATNETGFTALPGGSRGTDGSFDNIGSNGNWWSATESLASRARGRGLHYDFSDVSWSDYPKELGFSVRCVRD